MANTIIQLKYSNTTTVPTTLNVGEPAYSNTAGKLYIGANSNGTFGVYTIGGSYYTALVDAATDANTISTIVKRDASGIFSATAVKASLFGNANTAAAWQTARTIGVSGDANGTVSIDGSANANIPLTLGNSGVSAGTYGGSTNIPTFVVDAKGRLTSAANVAISTALSIKGDTGSNTVTLGTDALTFIGGDGITTTLGPNANVQIFVDNTVVRTSGAQSITGDLSVTGNLTITGTTTTVNTSTVTTTDSLIKLAANNTVGDVLDIGFYGQANTGTSVTYHGLVRQAAGNFFLFKGLVTDPTSNTLATGSLTAANTATLRANLTGGTVSSLSSAIAIADGGTGATSFSASQLTIYNGTNLVSLANTGTAGTYGNAAYHPVITTDAYGRVSGVTNTAIAIDTSQITSGILPFARGGSGAASYSTGQFLTSNGTAFVSVANTGTAGTYGNAAYHPVITTDAYGRVSGVTNTAIAIDTSQITSGTLGVARGGTGIASYAVGDIVYASGATTLAALADVATGNVLISGGVTTAPSWGKVALTTHVSGTLGVTNGGTGSSSFTANGVIYGGLTSTGALNSVASATEGHILQINTSGIPAFGYLNGGTF